MNIRCEILGNSGGAMIILNFSFNFIIPQGKVSYCYKTYRVVSRAPIDVLWKKLSNLADVSWNPLFSKTNVPLGLIAKPGLIFQAVTRLTPIPIRLFVENVRPGKLLSIRIMALPGVEHKITYQMESTLRGTYITCSVTLKGWLAPFIWWIIHSDCAKMANDLALAVEK
jgi:hypothetical protein